MPGRGRRPAGTHKSTFGLGCAPKHPSTHDDQLSFCSLSEVEVEEEVVLPLEPGPEEAGDGLDAEGAEAEEEAVATRRARKPSDPTDEERRRHETTHPPLPVLVPLLRSWAPGQPSP